METVCQCPREGGLSPQRAPSVRLKGGAVEVAEFAPELAGEALQGVCSLPVERDDTAQMSAGDAIRQKQGGTAVAC